jgi:hypothetical protein
LKKPLALAVAAGVIAAVGIGIGLSQFAKPIEQAPLGEITPTNNPEQESPPIDVNSPEQSLHDVFYDGFVAEGYPEGLAGLISADLEVVSSNSTHQHYIQTLGGGGTRELIISLDHVTDYTIPQTEEPIILEDGTRFYVIGKNATALADSYNVKMDFVIPLDSMSTELKQELGIETTQPVFFEQILGIPYASATTVPSNPNPVGPAVVGSVSDVYDGSGTQAGVRIDQAPVEPINRAGHTTSRQLVEYAEEVGQLTDDIGRINDERRVQEAAQRIQNEISERQLAREAARIEAENAAASAAQSLRAQRIAAGLGAAHVALTGYEVRNIVVQNQELMQKLQELLDCAENPTNPLAIKAKQEDPNYNRATVDRIKLAMIELQGVSSVRIVSTTLNAGIGGSGGLAGMVTMGVVSHASDSMLRNTILNDIIGNIADGVVPCERCGDNLPPEDSQDSGSQSEAPSTDTGAGYSEGQVPRDRLLGCFPNDGRVRMVIDDFEDGTTGTPHEVTFESEAGVTNLVISNGIPFAWPDRYEGESTGMYHERWTYVAQDQPTCTVEINGNATMKVRVLRHMSGEIVRAEWMPGAMSEELELAEVQVEIVGNMTVTRSPNGCDTSFNGAPTTEGHTVYGCNFFEVDERGGYYRNSSGLSSDDGHTIYDDCELYMGALTPTSLNN